MWLYWLWRLGMLLVGLVPRRLSHAAAGWLGTAGYYLMPRRRRIAQNNFSHVLHQSSDHAQVRRVARESFRNYARLLRDVMIYPSMPHAEIESRVTFLQPEYFEQAIARGKGTLVVTAHYGNMDIASAMVAMRFKPITLISETLKPRPLMDYIVQMRRKNNVLMYEYDRAPRRVLEALRRNEFVGMMMDVGVTHHFDLQTVELDFFGARTRFIAGPAQVALLTGATIIVGSTYNGPDARVFVDVTEPYIATPTGDRARDMQIIMQEVGRRLEQLIRKRPEQWYIFRPMWQDGHSVKR